MRNAPESGVERIKNEKELKKSDSRKVERKVKNLKKILTYTKGEIKEKVRAK